MEPELRVEVEKLLDGVKPSLGGADLRLKDVHQGTVTIQYRKPLSNPSACHVDRTRTSKEMVREVLADRLKEVVPGFKDVALLGEE